MCSKSLQTRKNHTTSGTHSHPCPCWWWSGADEGEIYWLPVSTGNAVSCGFRDAPTITVIIIIIQHGTGTGRQLQQQLNGMEKDSHASSGSATRNRNPYVIFHFYVLRHTRVLYVCDPYRWHVIASGLRYFASPSICVPPNPAPGVGSVCVCVFLLRDRNHNRSTFRSTVRRGFKYLTESTNWTETFVSG